MDVAITDSANRVADLSADAVDAPRRRRVHAVRYRSVIEEIFVRKVDIHRARVYGPDGTARTSPPPAPHTSRAIAHAGESTCRSSASEPTGTSPSTNGPPHWPPAPGSRPSPARLGWTTPGSSTAVWRPSPNTA